MKTVKIPFNRVMDIVATELVRTGELPAGTSFTVIAPTNGKSYVAYQWEEPKDG